MSIVHFWNLNKHQYNLSLSYCSLCFFGYGSVFFSFRPVHSASKRQHARSWGFVPSLIPCVGWYHTYTHTEWPNTEFPMVLQNTPLSRGTERHPCAFSTLFGSGRMCSPLLEVGQEVFLFFYLKASSILNGHKNQFFLSVLPKSIPPQKPSTISDRALNSKKKNWCKCWPSEMYSLHRHGELGRAHKHNRQMERSPKVACSHSNYPGSTVQSACIAPV